jgi:hypothetical protein
MRFLQAQGLRDVYTKFQQYIMMFRLKSLIHTFKPAFGILKASQSE